MKSKFDKKIIKYGNSLAICIPRDTIEKLGLKLHDILEVVIKKSENKQ